MGWSLTVERFRRWKHLNQWIIINIVANQCNIVKCIGYCINCIKVDAFAVLSSVELSARVWPINIHLDRKVYASAEFCTFLVKVGNAFNMNSIIKYWIFLQYIFHLIWLKCCKHLLFFQFTWIHFFGFALCICFAIAPVFLFKHV